MGNGNSDLRDQVNALESDLGDATVKQTAHGQQLNALASLDSTELVQSGGLVCKSRAYPAHPDHPKGTLVLIDAGTTALEPFAVCKSADTWINDTEELKTILGDFEWRDADISGLSCTPSFAAAAFGQELHSCGSTLGEARGAGQYENLMVSLQHTQFVNQLSADHYSLLAGRLEALEKTENAGLVTS